MKTKHHKNHTRHTIKQAINKLKNIQKEIAHTIMELQQTIEQLKQELHSIHQYTQELRQWLPPTIIHSRQVGVFFRRMGELFARKLQQGHHITYLEFCQYLSRRYKFAKSDGKGYLSHQTVVSYFKKERAGESYRGTTCP